MESHDDAVDGIGTRRRGKRLLRGRKIPIRMLVPNFFTLLSLCAGITAIRMAIEGKYPVAVLFVVLAGLIDGIDGRLARALKAQSRFGAELDSLADFVNFGVAPAIVVYLWGLGALKDFGWIAVLVFACCMGLRLARFNSMLDVDKPKWQGNYFTGMPAPAGAITVLMPLYIQGLDIIDLKAFPQLIALYTLGLAFLLVSTIPTFSGKQLGDRIPRELVLPIFGATALGVGLLWTYPYATMSAVVAIYLAVIPYSYRQFKRRLAADVLDGAGRGGPTVDANVSVVSAGSGVQSTLHAPSVETKH
jgi:CDP-diacylglycerol---serine O-phosphatidyltransferase